MFDEIEALEPRRLLSVSFDKPTGVLTIVGDNNRDQVIFSQEIINRLPYLRLHFNGKTRDYHQSIVKQIRVTTLAGPDTVILGTIHIRSRIDGGNGDDQLSGGDDKDTINGQGGNDYVFGRNGDDRLTGGAGKDRLQGANDNDVIFPDSDKFGDDTISGGRGSDTVDYSKSPIAVAAFVGGTVPATDENDMILSDVETIIGSKLDDTLVNSTDHGMSISGNDGNDTLTGGAANDTLIGGAGKDSMLGLAGNDQFNSSDGEIDTLDGGAGTDVLIASDVTDVVTNIP
jgi:Ca2+-binding RTX toxin-like protein